MLWSSEDWCSFQSYFKQLKNTLFCYSVGCTASINKYCYLCISRVRVPAAPRRRRVLLRGDGGGVPRALRARLARAALRRRAAVQQGRPAAYYRYAHILIRLFYHWKYWAYL